MAATLSEALRETIRVQDRRIPLLARHLSRLGAGGCDEAVLADARTKALRAAEAWNKAYGRMSLHVALDGKVRVEVTSAPSAIDVPGGPRIALVTSEEPQLPPGGAKPEDRSFWDRALEQARRADADLAVLVSPAGHVIDTSHATLWACKGDRLLTPSSPPALAGVSRGVVFDFAASLGLSAEEALLVSGDLDAADELILTTAVAGAVALRDRGGPAAEALTKMFAQVFAGGADA